jgi:hypothetical protein
MSAVARVELLRALTVFEDVPPGHKVVQVFVEGFEPHLAVGEFAVIDTTDKHPQFGELYAISFNSVRTPTGRVIRIVQPYNGVGSDVGVMFRFGLRRPGAMVSADGPLSFEGWPDQCLGRVVGVFQPLATASDGDPYARTLDGRLAGP